MTENSFEANRVLVKEIKYRDSMGRYKVEGSVNANGSDDELLSSHGLKLSEGKFYFDISDLTQYFSGNRAPTGIQRVQIEIISQLLDRRNVALIAMTPTENDWKIVNKQTLATVFVLSQTGADVNDRAWRQIITLLGDELSRSKRVVFSRCAYLVNLGTSWWIDNYASKIALAKAELDIRYVPFIHDIIPLKVPEHCGRDLIREFAPWIYSVLLRADFVLVNSEQTSRDVAQLSLETHGRTIEPIVCRLNAAPPMLHANEVRFGGALARLTSGKFALFVGTIESRKDHFFVFEAWLEMARTYGVQNVPMLACVGKLGWLNDAALSLFNNSEILQQKVMLLSNISDEELALLYKNCSFTIYNSHYEGWGLPVTESLCFGKIPLTPKNTSLPEAGEGFSLLFEPGNRSDFIAKARALGLDDAFRGKMEDRVRSEYKPREWGHIANQIIESLLEAKPSPEADRKVEIDFGDVYTLKKNTNTKIVHRLLKAHALKTASGWHKSEEWGTWTSELNAGLNIVLNQDQQSRDLFVYIALVPPRENRTVHFLVNGRPTKILDFGRVNQFVIPVESGDLTDGRLTITIVNDMLTDLKLVTNGEDSRFIGVGFRSFMICRSDDLLNRLNYIEREGYVSVVTWQHQED